MAYQQGEAGDWARVCEVPWENAGPDLVRRYRRHAIDAVRGVEGAGAARADTAKRMTKTELARGMRLVREALAER